MKTFFVDFEGYCEIKAETPEKAEEIFWQMIDSDRPLPHNIYVLDSVEEKTEG